MSSSGTGPMNFDIVYDEQYLQDLLDTVEDFDIRKQIRARLKELKDINRAQREERLSKLSNTSEDMIQKRKKEADEQKKRTLQMYDQMAKSGPAGSFRNMNIGIYKNEDDIKNVNTGEILKKNLVEEAIQERLKDADNRKKKILACYDNAAKSSPAGPKDVRFDNLHKMTLQESVVDKPKPSCTVSILGGVSRVTPVENKNNARAKFQQMDTKVNANFQRTNVKTSVVRSASDIKEMLLRWCEAKTRGYSGVNITNFSSCWADGLAFCALVHHYFPDAFNFDELSAQNRRKNFELAFKTAEEKADIMPLLDVEDMILMKNKPDWKCVFTYVQSLYRTLRQYD